MSTLPYEQRLQTLLQKASEAMRDIEILSKSSNVPFAEEHIDFVNKTLKERSNKLRKALTESSQEDEIRLPSLGSDERKGDSKTSKSQTSANESSSSSASSEKPGAASNSFTGNEKQPDKTPNSSF